MTLAAVACALLFRNPASAEAETLPTFSRATWFTIFGISIMTFNQAMVFSFVEVIGKSRGFDPANVLGVLIALGIVNFVLPSPLAALLQNRIPATVVVQVGPAVQAILALIVTGATAFVFWARLLLSSSRSRSSPTPSPSACWQGSILQGAPWRPRPPRS